VNIGVNYPPRGQSSPLGARGEVKNGPPVTLETSRLPVSGLVCSLPARAGVLAAANPVGGHYNKSKTVAENLKMNPALLSRFDLVRSHVGVNPVMTFSEILDNILRTSFLGKQRIKIFFSQYI
jgi:hypothetical protein